MKRRLGAAAMAGLLLAACTSGADGEGSAEPTSTSVPEADEARGYGPGWSAVHADAANSDYAAQGPRRLEPAWSLDLDGTVYLGPLEWTINLGATSTDDGRLYVTSTVEGCPLQALDMGTGETLWCSEEVDELAVVSATLIGSDGTLFVGDGEAMHAFGPDGTLEWEAAIDGVPLSAQLTAEGRLVFVTHIGVVYVLDSSSGEPMLDPQPLIPGATWDGSQSLRACARGTEECPSANTVAVDQETGRIFFTFFEPGAEGSGVRAMRYDEADGPALEPLWTSEPLPGGSGSSPTLSADGSRVYVTDNVDGLHALDSATGDIVWSVTIGYSAGGSPSVTPGGLIIPAGGTNAPVIAVQDDGDAGRVVWRRDDVVNLGVVPQAGPDLAYATVARGERQLALAVLDTTTGEEIDRHDIEGISIFSVGTTIAADGTVVVPTIVGGIHAFHPANEAGGD